MPFINDKLNYYNQKAEGQLVSTESVERNVTALMKREPSRYTFRVSEVMERLRGSIFGQEKVLENLEGMLNLVHADISENDRPLYIGMFLGPTGVGKTETVRILAESIYGDKDQFCRIDMNTLSQEHYAAAITGAPPGYVGSKEGNTLFDEEKITGSFSKPGIVLFDEIEKADASVIQTLLNIFDNGKMVVSSGERTISFRNSMIFMTSNLGSKAMFDFAEQDLKSQIKRLIHRMKLSNWGHSQHSLLEKIIQNELERVYTPEFLNRIDDICVFNWLEGEPVFSIIDKNIEELNQRLKKHFYQVELEADAKSFLVEKGFSKQYGARSIRRVLRKYVEIEMAKHIQAGDQGEGPIHFLVTAKRDALVFTKK
jgi:ATP-dependent Clp protease ATP-binding subunit ClpA